MLPSKLRQLAITIIIIAIIIIVLIATSIDHKIAIMILIVIMHIVCFMFFPSIKMSTHIVCQRSVHCVLGQQRRAHRKAQHLLKSQPSALVETLISDTVLLRRITIFAQSISQQIVIRHTAAAGSSFEIGDHRKERYDLTSTLPLEHDILQ